MRDFLLRSSVFDRMSGSLCDAVLDSSDSTARLERIERSNLFLVPLDTTREWYRYHHLFRDLLRHELERTRPELVPDLHQRAAAWHRNEGFVPEAIRHAVSAGEVAEAVELIAAHWSEPFNRGELETVKGWLDSLPRNAVAADPRLCVAEAWLAMDKGRLDAARDWAARAEAGLAGADEAPAMAADAAVLRAVHRFKTGALEESESAARQVLELEPEQDSFAESVAHLILGVTLYWTDRSVEAARELTHAAGSAERTGNDLGRSYALGYLAVIHADAGDLDEAEELAGTATAAGDDPGFVEHFVPMIGHLASGTVEEARGNLAEAERHVRRAVELSGRGAGRVEIAAARLALSKVRHALGDPAEARRLAREARLELEKCPDPGVLAGRVEPFERVLRAGRARRTRDGGSDAITDRELAVLRLLSTDLSLREIGDALYVSLNTVKTHTRGLYRKLSSSGRREAVERARERGLL
jgi:LuxR family maltose regulon positive regulatory protein